MVAMPSHFARPLTLLIFECSHSASAHAFASGSVE